MIIAGVTAVVTGGAQGIGAALVSVLADAGARVISLDLRDHATPGAAQCLACDVADEAAFAATLERIDDATPIGLMCSNAGILTGMDTTFANIAHAPSDVWNRAWAVNVMAHVIAARVLVPRMVARGGGYFLHTASAAGLLNQVGSAVYGTTKHAAVGFAEALAFGHRDDGIRVSLLCPQGVDTPMVAGAKDNPAVADGILPAATVAKAAVDAIRAERFLVLPHAVVADYMAAKTRDYDRWIGGMAKLQRVLKPAKDAS